MATILVPSVRSSAGPLLLAAGCCAAAIAGLAASAGDQPLSASTYPTRDDYDRDGLGDAEELVLGTLPYQSDTDHDSFSDLEEHARGSDPLASDSTPESADFGVGTCASQNGDMVTVLTSVYVSGSRVGSLSLEMGFVIGGHAYRLAPRDFRLNRGFLRAAKQTQDRLAGIEIGIPTELIRRRGRLSMFSIVRDTSGAVVDPAVSVLNFASFSGVIMSIEQVPLGVNNGGQSAPQGIVYRPLAGDNQIPSTWTSGEMCMQSTAAIGMAGVNIVHEVESAGCISMDTYCSPSDCAASVGQALALPDPAALAGG